MDRNIFLIVMIAIIIGLAVVTAGCTDIGGDFMNLGKQATPTPEPTPPGKPTIAPFEPVYK